MDNNKSLTSAQTNKNSLNNKMPNKFIIAVMYPNNELFEKAKTELIEHFGEIAAQSSEYDFTFTNYYEKEFGKNLKKKFLVFKKNVLKEDLPAIRIMTKNIEDEFRINGNRSVNIDPGFISKDELVMASLKKALFKEQVNSCYIHKILEFKNNKIVEFTHTFPDYRIKNNQDFFLAIQKSI